MRLFVAHAKMTLGIRRGDTYVHDLCDTLMCRSDHHWINFLDYEESIFEEMGR